MNLQMKGLKKTKIVVLSGAGISAESGLKTFRGSDGLWEGYNVYDVATPEAWRKDRELVQEFYNMRRKAVLEAQPNAAHIGLAGLEKEYDVTVITQNIDNLHERAGSSRVVHLHGEITKSRSTIDERLVYDIEGWELKMGDTCELGSQLRPHIVWFGEAVPMIETAAAIVSTADVLVVIGTSLQVYPAAGLVGCAPPQARIVVIDPEIPPLPRSERLTLIPKKASEGISDLVAILDS